MATVGDFLKFLSSPQNQLSPVALTFKNYFQHLFDSQEELEVDSLQSFFDSALTYPHWQQNKKDLSSESRHLLQDFLGDEGQLILSALDYPEDVQIFEVEKQADALEIINNYWSFRLKKEGTPFRLFETSDKMLLAVILHADQQLTIRQYDNRFVIRNGHLEPLRRDLLLVYDENLELSTEVMHKFEMSPFTVARFYREGDGIYGNAVRGYVFQHLQNFHGQVVEAFPRLFFALKRVEQSFVRRETDPYYTQLVESLERLLHWMRLGEPISPHQLHESFLKAQTALEEVFHGDKMLTLLLRDLEHLNARDQLRNSEVPANRPRPVQEPSAWNRSPAQVRQAIAMTPEPARKPAPAPQPGTFASIKPSRTVASPLAARPTASLKKEASPSMARGSSNLESKLISPKTRFSWRENP